MSELARVMTRAQGQIVARVYIYDSAGLERPASDGPIWQSAKRIPGVQVLADRDGAMARTFGAETSGASLLYDPSGRLLFQGGITEARGHEGENASEDALLTCLQKRPATSIRTHTYGCPIF